MQLGPADYPWTEDVTPPCARPRRNRDYEADCGAVSENWDRSVRYS